MPANTWGRRPMPAQLPREDSTSQLPPRITKPYSKSPVCAVQFSPRFKRRAAKPRCSHPALSGVTRTYSPASDLGRSCKGQLRKLIIDLLTMLISCPKRHYEEKE